MQTRVIRLSKWRAGFSLLELVVVLVVMVLLAAVFLPALGAARESARRLTCGYHLQQLGIAWLNAANVSGELPTASRSEAKAYWPLLPYLEQKPLYDRLVQAPVGTDWPRLDVFLCPSDSIVHQNGPGEVSYFCNEGTRFRIAYRGKYSPWDYGYNGFSSGPEVNTRVREFTDGLSQTAAMSEHLVAEWRFGTAWTVEEMERDPGRHFWWTPRHYSQMGDELFAAEMCRTELLSPYPFHWSMRGDLWRCSVGYDHMLTPNQRGCNNTPRPMLGMPNFNLIPATSLHPGGVNVLMADGHLRFVADSIDAQVWLAVGSRSGAERGSSAP